MKCACHPETEAVGICTSCNMPVCPDCGVPVENKTYCQDCIDEAFAPHMARPSAILGLISGIIALMSGMFLTIMALTPGGGDDEWRFAKHIQMGAGADWTQAGYGIALMGLGLLSVIGSRYAFVRQHYKLVLIGGICAALCIPLFGIPALILIILSRDEYNAPYTNSCREQPADSLSWLHW